MMQAAESFIVADQESGRVFSQRDSDSPRQVASLTKIATAVVALEWIDESGGDPSQLVTIIPEAVAGGVNPLKLRAGDQLTFSAALRAAMMASDNTAAYALAAALGSQMKPGSDAVSAVSLFVERMNALAARLGMERTHFVNPHGLDGGETGAFSTAADIARLAIHACDHPDFLTYCREKEHQTTVRREGTDIPLIITNTNELAGSRGVDGMKTGTTTLSGPCLVTTASREGRRLIVVVLKAEDRFRETVLLLDKAWPALEKWQAEGAVIDANDHLRKKGN
jgi:D-alanyl-D-alanine carboxypeptidase (penicillin-binding protein 5/6)